MKLEEFQFNEIRYIFEEILKREGYIDLSEVCGDQTEDFCKAILKRLNDFYANV